MNVGQLIKELHKYPENMKVFMRVNDAEYDYIPIVTAKLVTMEVREV